MLADQLSDFDHPLFFRDSSFQVAAGSTQSAANWQTPRLGQKGIGMSAELRRLVESSLVLSKDAEQRVQLIGDALLESSPFVDRQNFTAISDDDLAYLFEQYDQRFWNGTCQLTLKEMGSPLDFRVSPRMTRAGGKTTRVIPRVARGLSPVPRFEIAVSSTLLFQTFADVERPIKVTGLLCHNRLEALQRIFEHELIHLIEMLLWQTSCCASPRFKDIAERFFRHRESNHQLITPDERARERFGIRPGDRVKFLLEGEPHTGIVNRVTKRATILVEDPRGTRYSDGKRYSKFYIPVGMLERCA